MYEVADSNQTPQYLSLKIIKITKIIGNSPSSTKTKLEIFNDHFNQHLKLTDIVHMFIVCSFVIFFNNSNYQQKINKYIYVTFSLCFMHV